jgi:hypothetical protein
VVDEDAQHERAREREAWAKTKKPALLLELHDNAMFRKLFCSDPIIGSDFT